MSTTGRAFLCALALGLSALAVHARADGLALAFASAREASSLFEPRVEIGRFDLVIHPGDVLEYDLLLPEACAERAGVELVLADGRRTQAPTATAGAAWQRVRVPLDTFAGATLARAELVARRHLAAQIGFRVDDVVIVNATGEEPAVIFREALPSGVRILRDDARNAGVTLAPAAAGWDDVLTRLPQAQLNEPWSAYDLTNLRRTTAGNATGPRGALLAGPCVPMFFANEGQPACVRASGQRLALNPVEGGRFYTLWIAASVDDGEPLIARAFAYGENGERRALDFRVPAPGTPGAVDMGGCFLVEVPVASGVPLLGIQLPDERRLRIHAITFQWRRDGALDPRFRLDWLAREADLDTDVDLAQRSDLARYVANRRYGPLFVEVAADSNDADRAIFDALLAGDAEKTRTRLRERIDLQVAAGAPLKSLRIAFEDAQGDHGALQSPDGPGPSMSAEELVRAVRALPPARAVVVGGDLAELRQVPQLLSSAGVRSALGRADAPIARWNGQDTSSVELVGAFEPIDDVRQLGEMPWREWIDRARRGETTPELFVPVGGSDANRADVLALIEVLARVDSGPRVRSSTPEDFVTQAVKRLGKGVPPFSPDSLVPTEGSEATRESIVSRRRTAAAISMLETFGTIAHSDGAPAVDALVEELWGGASASDERARTLLAGELDVIAHGATTSGDGTPIMAFNPLPWPRTVLVALAAPVARAVGPNGRALASQPAAGGGSVFALDVPALGYAVMHAQGADGSPAAARSGVSVEGWTARNNTLAFTIDPASGAITSLMSLPERVEMLSGPARMGGDGWVVDSAAFTEHGPLRAVARIEMSSPAAQAAIEYVLEARSRVLEVCCTFARTDAGSLPAFEMPLQHTASRALIGVPFGSSTAAPLAGGAPARHRLLDWIAGTDGTRGVSVLARECATVLVAPGRLDVDLLPAAIGSARTTSFALVPFTSGWKKAGLAQLAQELAAPVELFATDAHPGARESSHSFVSLARVDRDGPILHGPESGLMLSALQPAPDGGWLLRIVETSGRAQDAVLEFDRPVFGARRVDLRGAPLGTLRSERHRVQIPIGAHRIENVHVRLRP